LPKNHAFDTVACRPHKVTFANKDWLTIDRELKLLLTIIASPSGVSFTNLITAFPLEVSSIQRHELILGRATLEELGVTIFGSSRVTINDTVVYERVKGRSCDDSKTSLLQIMQESCRLISEDAFVVQTEDGIAINTKYTNSHKRLVKVNSSPDLEHPEDLLTIVSAPNRFGRLQTRIPWSSNKRPPLNRVQVEIRDKKTTQRLTAAQRQDFNEAVETLIRGGYASTVEKCATRPRHYIPITPVFRDDKNTRCRLCTDARISNQFTITGKIQSRKMAECLLIFRSTPFVSTFDLRKAYWQVQLAPEERGYCSTILGGRELIFNCLCFGTNYSSSVLEQAVRIVLALANEQLYTNGPLIQGEPQRPTAGSLLTTNYVDDFSTRSQTREHELTQNHWVRFFFAKYGFDSDKAFSNADLVPSADWIPYLSHSWQPSSDKFRLETPKIKPHVGKMTLRQLVATVAQLHDPLGLFMNVQLLGRSIIRDAFKCVNTRPLQPGESGKNWNREIDPQIIHKLNEWVTVLPSVKYLAPRCQNFNILNVFVDASSTAWVFEIRDENFALIFTKGGLINERDTIPRGELIALYEAIVGTLNLDLKELRTTSIRFFTDSECNVYRLRRQKIKLPTFETNRVQRILMTLRDCPMKVKVIHIEGISNPADFCTRPSLHAITRPEVDMNILREICDDPENLYFDPQDFSWIAGEESDVNRSETEIALALSEAEIDEISDNVFRMETRSKRREARAGAAEEPNAPPTAIEIVMREGPIRSTINTELMDLILSHQNSSTIQKSENGKIEINHTDVDTVNKIIEYFHEDVHRGVNATIRQLKQLFTIKKISRAVRSYIRNCETCQKIRSKRKLQATLSKTVLLDMGDFNQIGINTIVGVDIATVDSQSENRHMLTVVCYISKFVRSETLPDQTADAVVSALSNIFSHSIYPRIIASDGGGCFRSSVFRRFCYKFGITILRFPPHASPYAGWVEREHQTIFDQIRKLVAKDRSKDWGEHLQTATWMVNNMPYSGQNEMQITPSHLVYSGYLFRRDPFDFNLEANETLLKAAQMAHLMPNSSPNDEAVEKMKIRKQMQLRDFREKYISRRLAISERLRKRLKSIPLEVGTWVRVWRPSLNKVAVVWSEPRLISRKISEAIREVKDQNGITSIEHVLNLARVSPGSIPLTAECQKN